MKIIIIHYRYFQASGPERYLFNVKKLFEDRNHTIIPFSINYKQNISSSYNKYFVNPVASDDNFHLQEIENITIFQKLKIVLNLFYNFEAKRKLKKLILDEKPDLVYCLQFFGKLSPSIIDACNSTDTPIIIRNSDFNLLCQKNIFYRDGAVCTECLSNEKSAIKHRCTQNSRIKSILVYLSRVWFFNKKYYKKVSAFISPSLFTKEFFKNDNRFNSTPQYHLPTFIWRNEIKNSTKPANKVSLCYFGRIAEDKGVHTLLKAINLLNKNYIFPILKIIGDHNNVYGEQLRRYTEENNLKNIFFYGFRNKENILNIIEDCTFSLVPSMWYDNMPNSLIESQSIGIPTIVSNIGSLKELITDGYNGFLFQPGNENDLAEIIIKAINLSKQELQKLRDNSIEWVQKYCSEESHYENLLGIFESTLNMKNR